MHWNKQRLAQYIKWKIKLRYHALRRQAGVHYARFAYWLPTKDPDFLGIGAPRTGSTWLYKRLELHPQVCLSKRKEIHFFNVQEGKGTYVYGPDARKPALKPLDMDNPHHWRWYRAHFGPCEGKLTGELTPDYTLLPDERIALIKERLPHLKLIYAMRNPVARAWSSVRKELWWRFKMHPHEVPDVEILKQIAMRPGVLARGDYASAIQRWEKHFEGQILYMHFDDIFADPQNTLYKVCDFLELDREPFADAGGHSKRVNDVPSDDIPDEVRLALEEYYAPQLPFLSAKFNRSFDHWISGNEQQDVAQDPAPETQIRSTG